MVCSAWAKQLDRLKLHRAKGSSETTVDQTLIRGLDTAFRVFVSGLSSV